jgi:zinc transporter ZupT
LRAFIAGGILFNMLQEELPAERESKAWAFVAGAVVYACLLLAVG